MNKLIGLLLYCITLNSMATIIVQDDNGQPFTLPKPAQRIISLAPGITEMLFAAGGADHIVGVIDYSDYPEAARRIPVVGDSRELDMERIITLKPDLLVVWRTGSSVRQMEQLRKLGIPLFFSEEHKLMDIPRNVQIFGQLMGTEIQANTMAADLRNQLTRLIKKYAHLSPVRLFYQVWDKPLYTLNGQHIVSDAIHVCGGVNIFANLKMAAPNVSIESVLQKNPEAIIGAVAVMPQSAHSVDKSGVAMWKNYPTMTAVKQNNLFVLDSALINRAGPRMIAGVAALCEKLDQARQHRR